MKGSRVETNRGLSRKTELVLTSPASSEPRFKLFSQLNYKRNEKFEIQFKVDNKIVRDVHVNAHFKRVKAKDSLVPEYKLELLLDSELIEPAKHYLVSLDLKPVDKDIKASLIVEKRDASTQQQTVQLIDGLASLTHTDDSDNEMDYDLDVQIETASKKKLHLYGHVLLSMFASNIDLSLEVTNKTLTGPINIRTGHAFDSSDAGKTSVEFAVRAPGTGIDHGLKVLLKLDVARLALNKVEFQVRSPRSGADTPYTLYFEKSYAEATGVAEYAFGVRNVQIALSDSRIGSALTKVDGQNVVRAFAIQFTRTAAPGKKSIAHLIVINKNEKLLAKVCVHFYTFISFTLTK